MHTKADRFFQTQPFLLSQENDAEGRTWCYIAGDVYITRLFSPDVNAIIQAQRNSLDYVIVALAEANAAIDPRDAYFPVTKCKQALSDKPAVKKLAKLDAVDRATVQAVNPYPGGNDTVVLLHRLNIERKHRRLDLLANAVSPSAITSDASGMTLQNIALYHTKPLSKSPQLIAIATFEGNLRIELALDIAFDGVPAAGQFTSIMPVLQDFSKECRRIVGLFQ